MPFFQILVFVAADVDEQFWRADKNLGCMDLSFLVSHSFQCKDFSGVQFVPLLGRFLFYQISL